MSLRSLYIIAACATGLVLYGAPQYRKAPMLKSKLTLTQIVLHISHDVSGYLKVAIECCFGRVFTFQLWFSYNYSMQPISILVIVWLMTKSLY